MKLKKQKKIWLKTANKKSKKILLSKKKKSNAFQSNFVNLSEKNLI